METRFKIRITKLIDKKTVDVSTFTMLYHGPVKLTSGEVLDSYVNFLKFAKFIPPIESTDLGIVKDDGDPPETWDDDMLESKSDS